MPGTGFATAAKNSLTGKAEEELVDLSCDRTLKAKFQQVRVGPVMAHLFKQVGENWEGSSIGRRACLVEAAIELRTKSWLFC